MTQTEALKMALDEIKRVKEICLREVGIGLCNEVVIAKLEEALAQPEPSPEWMTEEEQTAYTFGWFKALEQKRLEQSKEPEQYQQANPLGGPAKVFDAMAAAIRAGDSYESVLKQFGYQLAQPAVALQHKQEPYGYLKLNTGKFVNEVEGLNPMKDKRYLPLYTTPPQRKPLTDKQIDAIADKFTVHTGEMWEPELCIEFNDSCKSVHSFARAIEAAHGIKE